MEKERKEIKREPGIKARSWREFLSVSAAMILLSLILSPVSVRIDLTEDKRYTLSEATHRILSDLDNDVYIQVWLDGEMPVQFKKLRRTVKEMLDEFRISSGRKIDYEFINPSEGDTEKERNSQYESLIARGLSPVNIQSKDEEGGALQKLIFPGLTVNFNGAEVPVNFLRNNQALSPEQNLLNSMEGLEYEIIQTIATVSSDTVYKVAFIEGHGELGELETADITLNLARFFTVDRGAISGKPGILDNYSAVIIADPRYSFDDRDKFVIDQYIMNGGKVLWILDEIPVSEDSLAMGETVALYRPVNLADQLFRYGARINPSLVQDLECMLKPFNVISGGSRQQVVPVPWLYYPLLVPSPSDPVTRNLNRVMGRYASFIDTVGRDREIRKTILLSTSPSARTINPPVLITLNEARETPDPRGFSKSSLPVAVMLSGRFRSAFANRIIEGVPAGQNFVRKEISVPTRMIVIADGDIIRNEVRRIGGVETPLPLGQDRYTLQTFGNRDFIVNCVNALTDDRGLMDLRSRELKLRLLDKSLIREKKTLIQLVNLLLPVIIIIFAGIIYQAVRKRHYSG